MAIGKTRMHMYTNKFLNCMFVDAFNCRLEVSLDKFTIADLAKLKQEVRNKKLKDASSKIIRKKTVALKETNHSKDDAILENDIIISNDEVDGDLEVISNEEVVSSSKELSAVKEISALKEVSAIKESSTLKEGCVLKEGSTLKEKIVTNKVNGFKIPDLTKKVNLLNKSSPVNKMKTPKKPSSYSWKVKLFPKYKSSAKPKSATNPNSPLKPRSLPKTRCLDEPSSSETSHKKIKLNDKKKNSPLKMIISREVETGEFKPLLFNNKLNTKNNPKKTSSPKPSTSKCNDSNTNTDTNSEKPANPSSSLVNKVRICDIRKLIDASKYEDYDELWLDKKRTTNGTKKTGSSNNLPALLPMIKGHLPLVVIENLYTKYFNKAVQNTIVIIANILNIMKISNKHHKARMDGSFKKKTECEKLNERWDANRQHTRHKNVLESKLKMNFTRVVQSFEESDFETIFQMFFLAILHFLDQSKLKKSCIIKNLILLLWNSLKYSGYEHPKVFTVLKSKFFRSNCIDLNRLIKNSKDTGITDRLALFFVSNVDSCNYFKAVIDAVTSNTNEELEILIDEASVQCRLNSTFKDHIVNSPSVTMNYVAHKSNLVPNQTIARSINTIVPSIITSVTSIITTVTSTSTTVTSTITSVPSIITSVTSTITSVPSIIINVPSTITSVPSIITSVPSTITSVPSIITSVPSTITSVPSSVTSLSHPSSVHKTAKQMVIPKAPTTSSFQVPKMNSTSIEQKTLTSEPKLNIIGSSNVILTPFVAIQQFNSGNNNTTVQRPDDNTQYYLVKIPADQMKTNPQNANTIRIAQPLEVISYKRSDWYDNHMTTCKQEMRKIKRPNNQ
ncbi:Hypothetical protein CINCED_3A008814 [Cinara cedri]|uniref:Uncharacterized protein n=1 Tax=Cinara cedri TaxID=506608 RepID=A0A5E4N4Z4_9HEMI|nr:Hypothetical protein CINCED_3A008814 [Cinara cedri]